MARDALDLLEQDHREQEQLLKAVLDEHTAGRREALRRADTSLRLHDRIERELFYPAVREALGEDAKDLLEDSYEDHDKVTKLLDELSGKSPRDEDFEEKVQELMKTAVEHAKVDEEAMLFPKLRDRIPAAALVDLGRRMAARKEEVRRDLGTPAR